MMCIGVKTKLGVCLMAVSINCNEFAIKTKKDGSQYIQCTSKTLKPECSSCSILNPNSPKNNSIR